MKPDYSPFHKGPAVAVYVLPSMAAAINSLIVWEFIYK